jgi:hypothetical protein
MEDFCGIKDPKSRKPKVSNAFQDMPSLSDFDTLLTTVKIIPGLPSEGNHSRQSYATSYTGDSALVSSTKTIIYGISK